MNCELTFEISSFVYTLNNCRANPPPLVAHHLLHERTGITLIHISHEKHCPEYYTYKICTIIFWQLTVDTFRASYIIIYLSNFKVIIYFMLTELYA